jgi:hypothetical protein
MILLKTIDRRMSKVRRGIVTQRAHSRCRRSHRALALICALAVLAAFGMANSGLISPAFSQTPSPVTLSLFDPDLADLKAPEKLKDATSCYPGATFKVGAKYDDPLMQDALTKAREEALAVALKRLGLDSARFKIEAGATDSDDVQVSYPNSAAGKDTDGPKLKTSSVPKKGTKVKTSNTITVTINASERFEDGHKSWPTGVRSIQLLADNGPTTIKVDDKDYGMRPPPCERRSVKMRPYIVPANPPPIVHLHALAEDAVGNQSGEDAEFPTVDVWTGTMHSEMNANYGTSKYGRPGVCTGESWDFELRLLAGRDGEFTGKATGHLISMPKCRGPGFESSDWAATQGKTAAYDVAGRLNGQQFDLRFAMTSFDVGQGDLGLMNYSLGLVRYGRPYPTIVVPLTSPTTAQGNTNTRIQVQGSDAVASGSHTVDLKCTDC